MAALSFLTNAVKQSKKIVFFGGAGVSTESGIPDFRSATGLYRKGGKGVSPEQILSHSFYVSHTEDFYRFYRDHMLFPSAKPNRAHKVLAEWEEKGFLAGIVTQNIDGLHQAAGSRNVFELHGSIHRNTCISCGKRFSLSDILQSEGVPRCDCGGAIKPDVVLYEEPLDGKVIQGAVSLIASADLLIVAGTSLAVYPAASFLSYFDRRNPLVIINKGATAQDSLADCVINESVGDILFKVNEQL